MAKGTRKTNIEIMMFVFLAPPGVLQLPENKIGPKIIKIEVCWGLEGVLGRVVDNLVASCRRNARQDRPKRRQDEPKRRQDKPT